ncbi:MAG: extracellular matrix regulator RemB [Sulfobacillus sp.]
MYLHVGQDIMVATDAIVAILSKELLDTSKDVRELYARLRSEGRVSGNIKEAKTLVVTRTGIILSNISANTLVRRAGRLEDSDR